MRRVPPSRAYRLLYPTVPVVVAAAYRGKVSAMPAVSIVSLSNKPAIIGVASSPAHDTYWTAVKARHLSVSWLDDRHRAAVMAMGNSSGARVDDKLSSVGLHYDLDSVLGVPVLREASAYLACELSDVQRFGDHDLLVAEVKEAKAVRDFGGYWRFDEYRPILYAGLGRGSPTTPRLVTRP
jgi:flavin reductase (DIM6/NTAB) family NADH-FMN oxidoreductase RutF